jgi:hypothetical protein
LLEEVVRVAGVGADQKAFEVLVDEPACRRACTCQCGRRKMGRCCIPPKPVAKPTVPSVASISTKNEPSTLMPQLVREALYFSHLEHGVEMGESINQCPPFTLW